VGASRRQLLVRSESKTDPPEPVRLDLASGARRKFTDYRYAADGAGGAIASARALRVLVPLLFNPYEPVQFERVEVYDVDNGSRFATYLIEGERGSGACCVNGAAGQLGQLRDQDIELSPELLDAVRQRFGCPRQVDLEHWYPKYL
jgi:hypothetical protein